MANQNPNDVLTTVGGFSRQEDTHSAAALQSQRYEMGLTATGANLGIGRRTVPDPEAQFRNPPLSGAQMGSGHAKSFANFGGTEAEEED